MSELNYAGIYDKKLMSHSDGHLSYKKGMIKFGDALSAIAYAYGITYDQLTERFPQVKINNRFECGPYTVMDQVNFIVENHTRVPKNILEIGGGRCEAAAFMSLVSKKLGVTQSITCVEPGENAVEFMDTAKTIYANGESLDNITLLNSPLHKLNLDYSKYDAIIMIESLEHILAEHFDPEWDKIAAQFKGTFIVVNWISYHPIAVGQYAAPTIHCRLVDDALYDSFASHGETIHRRGSHLWIEIK